MTFTHATISCFLKRTWAKLASQGAKIDFWKFFLAMSEGVFGAEIKCFEFTEHLGTFLWPFPGILKQFEKIEKNHHFSIFLASTVSNLWRIWPFLSIKKSWKSIFQKQCNKSKKYSTNLLDITITYFKLIGDGLGPHG